MKERVISAIKIILMLGICIAGIAFMSMGKGNASPPPSVINHPIDTVTVEVSFYDKSAEEGLREALEFYDIKHPDIVYAQAILETGYFKSAGCLEHNNLFGLYNSSKGRYYRFDHWTNSVEQYKIWIQRRYKPPEDYYDFLKRINYASDSLYILKLKQIVKKENGKRGYTKGDSIS